MGSDFVVFGVGPYRVGLAAERVERVAPAAQVTPLPRAPAVVLGIVSIGGDIVAVVDPRCRLGLDPRPLRTTDCFVIACGATRRLALAVDEIVAVASIAPETIVTAAEIIPQPVQGIAATTDGIVLIQNLDRFLSLDEEARLTQAIEEHGLANAGRRSVAGAPVGGGAPRTGISPVAG